MSSQAPKTPFYKNPKIILATLAVFAVIGLLVWQMTKEKSAPVAPQNPADMTQQTIQSMTDSDQSWSPEKDITTLDDAELTAVIKQELLKAQERKLSDKNRKDIEKAIQDIDKMEKDKEKPNRDIFMFVFMTLRCKAIYQDLKEILSKTNLSLSKCADPVGVGQPSTPAAAESTAETKDDSKQPILKLGKLLECTLTTLAIAPTFNQDAFTACALLIVRIIPVIRGKPIHTSFEFKNNKIIIKGLVKELWIKNNKELPQADQIPNLEQSLNQPLTTQEFSSVILSLVKLFAVKNPALKNCKLCQINEFEDES